MRRRTDYLFIRSHSLDNADEPRLYRHRSLWAADTTFLTVSGWAHFEESFLRRQPYAFLGRIGHVRAFLNMERRIKVPAFAAEYVDAVSARDWRGTLRGWQDFAVSKDGDQAAFNLPKGPMVKARVVKNVSYFITNYVLVYATLTVYGVVSDAYNLFISSLLGGCWYFVVKVFPTLTNTPSINGKKITQQHLYMLTGAASAVIGFILLGEIFWSVLTVGTIFNLGHAAFRIPSYRDSNKTKSDEEEALGNDDAVPDAI